MFLTGRRARGRDTGFTLIELLVCIVILGIIAVPLSMALFSYFKNSDSTQARLSESHDAQIAAAYFAQDVASVGTRASDSGNPYNTSVWLSDTGPYPCGGSGTILKLAWDDYAAVSTKTIVAVAYVVEDTTELHRVVCRSGSTTDITVVHNLAGTPAIRCGAPGCTASTTPPQTITMTVAVKAAGNNGDPYTFTLSGDRRQT
jgi:prepilin-type N-terminal cleavage/methylation domain-containing protein